MNPLAIALQGIMYPEIAIATQGFIGADAPPPPDVGTTEWVVRLRRLARR